MNEKKIQLIKDFLCTIEDSPDWEVSGPVVNSREGTIYKACLGRADLVLAVKCYSHGIHPVAPQKQAKALMNCQDDMAGKGREYTVPEVFAYDNENRFLVMEWIEGRSLHNHLWSTWSSEQVLFKTGRWLREFHDTSGTADVELKLNSYLKDVEKRIDRFPENLSASTSEHPLFRKAYGLLQQVVASELPVRVPQAIAHGDFTPFNVLLTKQQIIGLDIWGLSRKPVVNDVVRMMVYLTVAYPLVTRQPLLDDTGVVQKKLKPLLEGYGYALVDPDLRHFRIALLSEYLRRWLVIASRSRTLPGAFFDSYQVTRIKKLLPPILNALS